MRIILLYFIFTAAIFIIIIAIRKTIKNGLTRVNKERLLTTKTPCFLQIMY